MSKRKIFTITIRVESSRKESVERAAKRMADCLQGATVTTIDQIGFLTGRQCLSCGTDEQVDMLGFSNVLQHSGRCNKCMNVMMQRDGR